MYLAPHPKRWASGSVCKMLRHRALSFGRGCGGSADGRGSRAAGLKLDWSLPSALPAVPYWRGGRRVGSYGQGRGLLKGVILWPVAALAVAHAG